VSRRDEILAKLFTISALPAVATEVTRLLQDPESEIADIVQAIEYDPGLTSNVLRLANSAYYGFRESVSSVRDAVVRLGTKSIFQMVVSWAFSPMAQMNVPGYGLPAGKLWEHSVAVAFGAEQLSKDLKVASADHTFTAGLLHDIGKIALGTFVQIDIDEITGLVAQDKISFEAAEQHVLGIDHAEAGAILLDNWNLPPLVGETTRWHHQPDFLSNGAVIIDLVHVADTMCLMGGIGSDPDGADYQTSPEVVSRLNLTAFTTDAVISQILDNLDELAGLYSGNGSK